MPDQLKRKVVSDPGSAIHEIEIELPDYLREAISENLERGKRTARKAAQEAETARAFGKKRAG